MSCSRRDGLMVRDYAFDLLDTQIHSQVWRCVCCGNMTDPLILRIRLRQRTWMVSRLAAETSGVVSGPASLSGVIQLCCD